MDSGTLCVLLCGWTTISTEILLIVLIISRDSQPWVYGVIART